MFTLFKLSIVLCSSLFLVGCSDTGDRPELGLVEGIVHLDGKPLPGAAVIFMPHQCRASRGKTDADGHYELTYIRDIKGAKVGESKVRITTYGESGPVELVPRKYNFDTELKREVKVGQNKIDFELESS